MDEAELFALSLGLFCFVLGFLPGLLLSYKRKKELERGKIDSWKEEIKPPTRTKGAILAGFGVILALLGYYYGFSDVGLIELLLGVEVHILFEALLVLGFVAVGMSFLGLGLAILIYPIKYPATD